mmetsp:Transcript_35445/g.62952  ORF Transcript_35445/g.62952 Transcript_35445/m.62952 type:complete len:200 (-) Transcript_35445:333-932(-)
MMMMRMPSPHALQASSSVCAGAAFMVCGLPAVKLVIHPVANLLLVGGVRVLAPAVTHSSLPFAIVAAAVFPCKLANSMLQVILVLSLIDQHAFLGVPDHFALAIELAILESSLIRTSVIPNLLAPSMLLVRLPLALIAPCGTLTSSMPMSKTILKCSCILGAVLIGHRGHLPNAIPTSICLCWATSLVSAGEDCTVHRC